MAEVAYEVRDYVSYMVAAEGYQANTGWPYDRIIQLLHEDENLQPRAFASGIVDEHVTYYDDYTVADLSVDLAAIDLKQLDGLVQKLDPKQLTDGTTQRGLSILMSDAVKNPRLKDAIILAHWEAQDTTMNSTLTFGISANAWITESPRSAKQGLKN